MRFPKYQKQSTRRADGGSAVLVFLGRMKQHEQGKHGAQIFVGAGIKPSNFAMLSSFSGPADAKTAPPIGPHVIGKSDHRTETLILKPSTEDPESQALYPNHKSLNPELQP